MMPIYHDSCPAFSSVIQIPNKLFDYLIFGQTQLENFAKPLMCIAVEKGNVDVGGIKDDKGGCTPKNYESFDE